MNSSHKISTKLIVTASSLLSICLVVFIAITANHYITRMSENNNELYNTYHVSELLKSFRTNIISLDGNQKRYMLTGDAKFVELYHVKETEVKTLLKSMEKYFEGKTPEPSFDKLRDLTYRKLAEAKELKQGGNLAGLQGMNNSEEPGIKTIDEINTTIEEIITGLSQTSQALINNSVQYLNVSKKWNLLEIVLGIVLALAGVIILFRDIDLRNRLENELRNAKKQAEDNANIKEQFMANVSHEIRTPMNAILGFSELLNKTKLDATQTEYLTAISSSSSNLLNIINDILDFSKIEAGKLHIEKISFALHEQLNAIRMMFSEKARQKAIELELSIDEKVPAHIFGDPTRLNQVLINLMNNAVKFTDKGGVKLSCELKGFEHDVAQLVFRVKDTGVGIPDDKLKDVFERFNQGNKETTRKYGGTGLGLAIVKSLVEIQNGSIYVKSKEGKGSEFVVTLSYPVSYETSGQQARMELQKLPQISNGKHTVLLVEDNTLNQKLALSYLEGFGLRAHVAENGEVALKKLGEQRYDLVLMDIQMPLLDGYNATLKIRNELKLNLPVIAMTAHVIEGEREKCLSYGMNDYISKPFREADLHTAISRYIQSSVPADTSKTGVSPLPPTSLLNVNELLELSRGNMTFVQEMITLFMVQNPADISELEDAIAIPDYVAIRATAHRMKTSVGFMGLGSLTAPLNRMELLAENKAGISEIEIIYQAIKRDCSQAVKELKEVLAKIEKGALT